MLHLYSFNMFDFSESLIMKFILLEIGRSFYLWIDLFIYVLKKIQARQVFLFPTMDVTMVNCNIGALQSFDFLIHVYFFIHTRIYIYIIMIKY